MWEALFRYVRWAERKVVVVLGSVVRGLLACREGPAGLPPARGAWAGGPAAAWRGTTAGSSAALLMCAVLVSHQEAEAAEAAAAHARHLQAAQLRCGVAPSAPRAAAIAIAVEQAAAVGAACPLLPAARQMEGV